MPACFDQFRRQDAHGAVVGGKRLVKLGHFAANGRFALDEEDLDTRVGEIQGGLDASNAATDYERCSYRFDVRRFRHWALLRRDSCPSVRITAPGHERCTGCSCQTTVAKVPDRCRFQAPQLRSAMPSRVYCKQDLCQGILPFLLAGGQCFSRVCASQSLASLIQLSLPGVRRRFLSQWTGPQPADAFRHLLRGIRECVGLAARHVKDAQSISLQSDLLPGARGRRPAAWSLARFRARDGNCQWGRRRYTPRRPLPQMLLGYTPHPLCLCRESGRA